MRKRGSLKGITMNKSYYVYIMGNIRPTLYTGVTDNLIKRVYQHKEGLVDGFTKKYSLKKLLYYEEYQRAIDAITREKHIKHWKRDWKLQLIKKVNPIFKDLYNDLIK